MKILADSNMFIDFWKKPTPEIVETFSKEKVVICGVIKAELMHGAKSEKDLKKIKDVLEEFEELQIEPEDWNELGVLLHQLRINGITVPFQDAIIAMLAVKHHVQVWTKDRHFVQIKRVMNDLQLY